MIEFKVKLPSLPPIPPMPNLGRYIMITVLVASLIMSGTSMYVTLAAPQRSIFVPSTVGFEGQLADSEGAPVVDGDYAITFRLYTDSTGGTPVWEEEHTDPTHLVHVVDGLYSVQLGSIEEFAADTFNDELFLGVQVGSDGEMTPRIPVSAVPFALNAEQARGLQGYPVSDDMPGTNDLLGYDGTAWAPRDMLTFPDLAPVGSNASPNDLLRNYRSGAILTWADTDTVTASPGELMINGYMRRNADPVGVEFTPAAGGSGPNRGLDTGTAQSDTTYYIYAVADDAENTFDLIISASDTAPSGRTNYRKLGSFKTEAGSINILGGSVANVIEAAAEYPRRAFGFHINDTVIVGNALYRASAGQMFYLQAYQNPGTNGDTFTTSFMLQAGTYTLYVLGYANANRGRIDWYVDDVLQIAGQDWYAATETVNVLKSGTITVTGDGYHVLKGVVNGRNASSNGYLIPLSHWWIAPDSD